MVVRSLLVMKNLEFGKVVVVGNSKYRCIYDRLPENYGVESDPLLHRVPEALLDRVGQAGEALGHSEPGGGGRIGWWGVRDGALAGGEGGLEHRLVDDEGLSTW